MKGDQRVTRAIFTDSTRIGVTSVDKWLRARGVWAKVCVCGEG